MFHQEHWAYGVDFKRFESCMRVDLGGRLLDMKDTGHGQGQAEWCFRVRLSDIIC